MRRTNIEGYHSYLKELPIFKQSDKIKEYYLRVRFYSEITNSTRLLTKLADKREEGDEEVNVIEDRAEICKRLVKKFRELC